MTPLVLVGPRASGKTQISQYLARHWQCPFVDLDHWVAERSLKTPSQWIEEDREIIFRHWEFALLKEWLAQPRGILATGGGTPFFPQAISLFKNFYPVIWLQNSPRARLEHLKKKPRPTLSNHHQLADEIHRLDQERNFIYQYVSDFTVNTDTSPEKVFCQFERLRARLARTIQKTTK